MRVRKGIVTMQHKFNIIAHPFLDVNSKLFKNHNSVKDKKQGIKL